MMSRKAGTSLLIALVATGLFAERPAEMGASESKRAKTREEKREDAQVKREEARRTGGEEAKEGGLRSPTPKKKGIERAADPIHDFKPLSGRAKADDNDTLKSVEEIKKAYENSKLDDTIKKQAVEQNDFLLARINDEDSKSGFIAKENMLFRALGNKPYLTLARTGKFIRSLINRIKGQPDNGDLNKIKVTQDDVKTVKSLVCPGECGTRVTKLGCRIVGRFLEATSKLAPAAFAAAFVAFMNSDVFADDSDPSKVHLKEVAYGKGENDKVRHLDVAIAEETDPKVVPHSADELVTK